ncbi:hypothetical protein CVH10_22435, partial [Halomonas sp. ND22Bw]|uniref:hypothetical protein n=1 Tax=Halomonas sp. ND22Bw TaxID=2054178 RepID=UPI000D26CCB9
KGMVTGLAVGVAIWLAGRWPALLGGAPWLPPIPPGLEALAYEPDWYLVTLVSLAANVLVFILFSLATRTSAGERAAAEACSVDAV